MDHNFFLISLTLLSLWEIVTPMNFEQWTQGSSSSSSSREKRKRQLTGPAPIRFTKSRERGLAFMLNDMNQAKASHDREDVIAYCEPVMAALRERERNGPKQNVKVDLVIPSRRIDKQVKLRDTFWTFQSAFPEHIRDNMRHHKYLDDNKSTFIKLDHEEAQHHEPPPPDLNMMHRVVQPVIWAHHYLRHLPPSIKPYVSEVIPQDKKYINIKLNNELLDGFYAHTKAHGFNL